jgi:hypothetical protein
LHGCPPKIGRPRQPELRRNPHAAIIPRLGI